jgi:hypothetical protein
MRLRLSCCIVFAIPSPPLQIATVLALEKGGSAALESLETAAGLGGPMTSIPTAYKR